MPRPGRPSQAQSSGRRADLSGLGMALAGVPEAAGMEQEQALALAEGPNGPVATNTPRQLFSKPNWAQKLFNPQGVAAQAGQQAAYDAQFTLAQQAAALRQANALALQAGDHTNAMALNDQRATLNENARQREIMTQQGFAEDERIRQQREADAAKANIGRAFASSNMELVPQGFNNEQGQPDYTRIGQVVPAIIGSQGAATGFMGLDAQQAKNNEALESANLGALISKQNSIGRQQPSVQEIVNTSVAVPIEASNAEQGFKRDYWKASETMANKIASDAKGTMLMLSPNDIGLSLNPKVPSLSGRPMTEEPIMNNVGGVSVYSGHNKKIFGQGGFGPSVETTVAADIKAQQDLNEAKAAQEAKVNRAAAAAEKLNAPVSKALTPPTRQWGNWGGTDIGRSRPTVNDVGVIGKAGNTLQGAGNALEDLLLTRPDYLKEFMRKLSFGAKTLAYGDKK